MVKPDKFVGIVQSSWLSEYSNEIANRCQAELKLHGIDSTIIKVPNAMSLAYAVLKLAKYLPDCRAFLAIAVIERGETRHADFVAQNALGALCRAMERLGKPIACELLVCDTLEQIKARCSDDEKNRGLLVSRDLIELLELERYFSKNTSKISRK